MFIQPFEINDFQMLVIKYKAGNMKKYIENNDTEIMFEISITSGKVYTLKEKNIKPTQIIQILLSL